MPRASCTSLLASRWKRVRPLPSSRHCGRPLLVCGVSPWVPLLPVAQNLSCFLRTSTASEGEKCQPGGAQFLECPCVFKTCCSV